MNNRWTIEEESKLLKSISTGKTCKELCGGFNRSENALELRLKKIIFENISNGKPADRISTLLNMPKDKIMQYYYSYKDYVDKQQNKQSGGDINVSEKINQTTKLEQINKNMNINTNNISGGYDNLENLETQNKKMKLLIENYILKQKLSKILKARDNKLYKETIKTLIN
jgi:hypothetical protein